MISQTRSRDFRYCLDTSFVDSENSEGVQCGEWRDETQLDTGFLPLGSTGSNNYSRDAKEVRDDFRTYFNSSEGEASWQLQHVNRTIDPFDQV